ncbi:MAG: hypothetical protein ACTSUE_16760 [Promethearchaeota archaeon]
MKRKWKSEEDVRGNVDDDEEEEEEEEGEGEQCKKPVSLVSKLRRSFTSTLDAEHQCDFSEKLVHLWTKNDVRKWLETLVFAKKEFQIWDSKKLRGKDLLEMNHTYREFKKSLIIKSDKEHIYPSKFFSCVRHLQESKGVYESEWFIIFIKLLGKNMNTTPSIFSVRRSAKIATIYSNEDLYFKCYFEPFVKMYEVYELYNALVKESSTIIRGNDDDDDDDDDGKDKVFLNAINDLKRMVLKYGRYYLKTFSWPLSGTYYALLPPILRDHMKIPGKIRLKEGAIRKCVEEMTESKSLKMKLILIDIFKKKDKKKKMFRKIISPLISRMSSLKQEFGMYHTAISIGPWYLHWVTRGLVDPLTEFKSQGAMFVLDLEQKNIYDMEKDDLIVFIESICHTCFQWNTRYVYSQLEGQKKGNCQHFVIELMDTLNLHIPKIKNIKNLFDSLRKGGIRDIAYVPSAGFKKKARIKWTKRIFKSHSEIDKFIRCKQPILKNFQEDMIFLKSIDRAFWLKEHEKCGEHFDDTKIDCPLGSPFRRHSYFRSPTPKKKTISRIKFRDNPTVKKRRSSAFAILQNGNGRRKKKGK